MMLNATYCTSHYSIRHRLAILEVARNHIYLKRGTQVRASAKLYKTTHTTEKKNSVIPCCSITLNSGCECMSKAISYISLVNFDIIWKFFVYVVFLFSIKYKNKI